MRAEVTEEGGVGKEQRRTGIDTTAPTTTAPALPGGWTSSTQELAACERLVPSPRHFFGRS